MMGRAFVCDHHLRGIVEPDVLATIEAEYPWVEWERTPWNEMHRYPQHMAQPDWTKQATHPDGEDRG
jgi:hypothetical protein